MVLWEITLATAYFLGLKRTYRLALKTQRRLISPKHAKFRQFLHRRTRGIFDVVLRVHRNIQERDLEVGRNLGNKILRYLDRIKPSAQIRGPPPNKSPNGSSTNSSISKPRSSYFGSRGGMQTPKKTESDRHMFASSKITWRRHLPTISMMMRPRNSAGSIMQSRYNSGPGVLMTNSPRSMSEGVIRKDIMEWLLQK